MKRIFVIFLLALAGSFASAQTTEEVSARPDSTVRATADSLYAADIPALAAADSLAQADTLQRAVRKRPVLGLSSNLLYDFTYIPNYGLTSIPSFSLEYYPSDYGRFSFGADVEWPMWQHPDEHRYFQIQNVTLHGRWYFSPKYDNDYRGVYALANFNIGRYGIGWEEHGWEGEGLGGSLGIGYKHRLFGSERLYWDTGIALGVFYSRYDPYVWGDDGTGWYYYDFSGAPSDFIIRNHYFLWAALPTRIWFAIGVDLFNRKKDEGR